MVNLALGSFVLADHAPMFAQRHTKAAAGRFPKIDQILAKITRQQPLLGSFFLAFYFFASFTLLTLVSCYSVLGLHLCWPCPVAADACRKLAGFGLADLPSGFGLALSRRACYPHWHFGARFWYRGFSFLRFSCMTSRSVPHFSGLFCATDITFVGFDCDNVEAVFGLAHRCAAGAAFGRTSGGSQGSG